MAEMGNWVGRSSGLVGHIPFFFRFSAKVLLVGVDGILRFG